MVDMFAKLEHLATSNNFILKDESSYFPLGIRSKYILENNNFVFLKYNKIESASASVLNKIINLDFKIEIENEDNFLIEKATLFERIFKSKNTDGCLNMKINGQSEFYLEIGGLIIKKDWCRLKKFSISFHDQILSIDTQSKDDDDLVFLIDIISFLLNKYRN